MAGLVLLIALVTAVMFMSIDWFVSVQFSQLTQERTLSQVEVMRQQLESERESLGALGELIATDSDLRQSAQYHLFLEGERRQLELDVERIASAFRFDLFGVWDAGGDVVLINEGGRMDVVEDLDVTRVMEPQFIWHNETLWVFSTMPIVVNEVLLAWAGIVREVGTVGREPGMLREVPYKRGTADTGPVDPSRLIDIVVLSPQGAETGLELPIVDPVGEAMDRTKRVVGITLLGAGVLLMLASVIYLRRLLNPVRELTHAVTQLPARLERGDLQPIRVRADGEVAALGIAFNEMIRNLLKWRTLEAELREKEKLSAIGRVAVRVAHDINNPLTVIKNTAHLMKSSPALGGQERADLEMILHHCRRCGSTVDNLLRFGKPLRLRYQDIEVNACMGHFLDSLRQRRPDAPVRYVPHPELLRMRGDRQQLEQMMDNLIDNALAANGGREVLVESGSSEDGLVYFRITDHGKGFGEDELAHVFDFFYTRTPGGTGLGLPNARAIARAHGGDVKITDPRIGQITVLLARDAPVGTDAMSP